MCSSTRPDLHAIAIDLHNVGTAFHKMGDNDTAMDMYRESLKATLELLPLEDASHNNINCIKKETERRLAKVSLAKRKLATLASHDLEPKDDTDAFKYTGRTYLIAVPLEVPVMSEQHWSLNFSSGLIMYNMALTQYKRGSIQTSMKLFESALDLFPEEASFLRPAIWNNLGHIAFRRNRPEDAIYNFSEAWKLGERMLRAVSNTNNAAPSICCDFGETNLKELINQHVATIITNDAFATNYFGELAQQVGHYDAAAKNFKVAFDTRERFNLLESHRNDLPQIYSKISYNYGGMCFLQGEYTRGRLAFNICFSVRRCALNGKVHQEVASLLYYIGMIQMKQGHAERAILSFDESLALYTRLFGNDHEDVAKCQYCIGQSYVQIGEHNKAMDFFQESLRIEKACLGQQHLDVAKTMTCIGHVYHRCGNLDKALEVYQEVLQIMKKSTGDCGILQVELMNAIGNVHIEQGNMCKANEVFVDTESLLISLLGAACADSLLGAPCAEYQELHSILEAQERIRQVMERPPGAGAA